MPSPGLRQLQRWCRIANRAGREIRGQRNTCVLTSHALAAFLRARELEAEVFRAEVHAHHLTDRKVTGFCLGWDGDGTRRPAAAPGMWRGHLAVTCEGFILDPTIDQSAVGKVRIKPAVFAMPPRWDEGCGYRWDERGISVAYSKYHRQAGWKSAGDARLSHWREVMAVMERLAG